jgi:hypothetical protein
VTDREWERIAAVAAAFEQTQLAMWSSMWPLGHCAVSSLLLAPMLRCATADASWRVAVGIVAHTINGGLNAEYERKWGEKLPDINKYPLPHAWCENDAGDVVDCTYGQFDLGDALVMLKARETGDLGHYAHRIMTLDEEELARRAITPHERDGWSAGSIVKRWFERIDYL